MNKKFWEKKFLFPAFVKACTAEQYYLGCFLTDNNRKPTLVFNNKPKNIKTANPNDNYCPLNVDYFNKRKIIHLFGDNKILFYKLYKKSKNKNLNINSKIVKTLLKMFQEKLNNQAKRNFKNIGNQLDKEFQQTLKILKNLKMLA